MTYISCTIYTAPETVKPNFPWHPNIFQILEIIHTFQLLMPFILKCPSAYQILPPSSPTLSDKSYINYPQKLTKPHDFYLL